MEYSKRAVGLRETVDDGVIGRVGRGKVNFFFPAVKYVSSSPISSFPDIQIFSSPYRQRENSAKSHARFKRNWRSRVFLIFFLLFFFFCFCFSLFFLHFHFLLARRRLPAGEKGWGIKTAEAKKSITPKVKAGRKGGRTKRTPRPDELVEFESISLGGGGTEKKIMGFTSRMSVSSAKSKVA